MLNLELRKIKRAVGLGVILLFAWSDLAQCQEKAESRLPIRQLIDQECAQWNELFERHDFRQLDEIGDRLRTQRSKFPNGRGRYWYYSRLGSKKDIRYINDDEFAKVFDTLEAWRVVNPSSVNLHIVGAQSWIRYAERLQKSEQSSETKYTTLEYDDRLAKAESELRSIAESDIDNVNRRLRIDLSKCRGVKPDVELVYEGLKADPLGMELAHRMSLFLLPRWYGEDGELEEFADELARRTQAQCGEFQYLTVALSTKEMLKAYTLSTHPFDWDRLKQGFLDIKRLYPDCHDYLNDKAQFAFMADDLETVYQTMEQIGDQPDRESWELTGISFERFRNRITREMLKGEQRRLLMSRTSTCMAVHALQDGDLTISVDSDTGVWSHNTTKGQRLGWAFLGGIRPESVSIDPDAGLLLTGFAGERGGALLYHLLDGSSVQLPIPEGLVRRTAISGAGGVAATATFAGQVTVIGLQTGKAVYTFTPPVPREVRAMEFSPQADQLAVVTKAGELQILNIKGRAETLMRKVSSHPLCSVDWAGSRIAIGNSHGEVQIFPDASQIEMATAITWKPRIANLAASLDFSPDQKKLAIGLSNDNRDIRMEETLYVWEFGSDKPATQLIGHKMGVNSVRFIDQGRSLLSGSSDWSVRVWDAP